MKANDGWPDYPLPTPTQFGKDRERGRGPGFYLSLFKIASFASITAIVLRAMAGIGLIAGSVVCGVLLLFALNGAVKMLGNYARLHYRLLRPEQRIA